MAPRVAELNGAYPVAATVADGSGADGSGRRPVVARARNLGRAFEGRQVLSAVDLDIVPGEFVALLGRSGSGKSTLLRALAGLDREVTGDLVVDGTVAVAFQEPRLLPWRRVLANVSLGLRTGDPVSVAANALAEVGLTTRANAWPLTLSGGEAQRASLARPLSTSRGCCSWTSRSVPWMPSPEWRCTIWSSNSGRATSRPSLWSPTTSTRLSPSPIAPSSSVAGALPSSSRCRSDGPVTTTSLSSSLYATNSSPSSA